VSDWGRRGKQRVVAEAMVKSVDDKREYQSGHGISLSYRGEDGETICGTVKRFDFAGGAIQGVENEIDEGLWEVESGEGVSNCEELNFVEGFRNVVEGEENVISL
jgi:hypothetical protein